MIALEAQISGFETPRRLGCAAGSAGRSALIEGGGVILAKDLPMR